MGTRLADMRPFDGKPLPKKIRRESEPSGRAFLPRRPMLPGMDYHTLISSTDSELPAWKRISSAIERAVARGEIPIGTRLPSERTLARQLDKSRTTVVSAYDD